jgi:hypothetical protein
MSEGAAARAPSPAMMPRRRPVIPPAERPPTRSTYLIAADIPRRGVAAAIWPDTGVLLNLGTDQQLLDRFRSHYRGRIRLAKAVARELRRHSELSTIDLAEEAHDRVRAASLAVRCLLVGPGRLNVAEPDLPDLPEIENVALQLKSLSEATDKRHGGEAEIIVLAAKHARLQRNRQVLLTNDGGASVVANQHGIPSRHFGDILAEFACADRAVDAANWLSTFVSALRVSAPPVHCRPTDAENFACFADASGCASCDAY